VQAVVHSVLEQFLPKQLVMVHYSLQGVPQLPSEQLITDVAFLIVQFFIKQFNPQEVLHSVRLHLVPHDTFLQVPLSFVLAVKFFSSNKFLIPNISFD